MEILKLKIDNAAISLRLWESRLDAMLGALSSLDYIYENGDINQKRQLIALLFKNPILWNDHCFKNLLNDNTKIIYNHPIEVLVADENNSTELNELSVEYKLIIETEQRKGMQLSASQVKNTLSFLYDLANFTIEFYNHQLILKNQNLLLNHCGERGTLGSLMEHSSK